MSTTLDISSKLFKQRFYTDFFYLLYVFFYLLYVIPQDKLKPVPDWTQSRSVEPNEVFLFLSLSKISCVKYFASRDLDPEAMNFL